jgi:hypothetical protein
VNKVGYLLLSEQNRSVAMGREPSKQFSRLPMAVFGGPLGGPSDSEDYHQGVLSALGTLFQVLMGLALTTGVLIFVTTPAGLLQVRSLSSLSVYEILVFVAFLSAATFAVFDISGYLHALTSAAVVAANATLGQLLLLLDCIAVVLSSLLFTLLALTLRQVSAQADALSFYYVYGAYLALFVVTSILRLVMMGPLRSTVSRRWIGRVVVSVVLDIVWIAAGLVLIMVRVPNLPYFLLALVGADIVADYVILPVMRFIWL